MVCGLPPGPIVWPLLLDHHQIWGPDAQHHRGRDPVVLSRQKQRQSMSFAELTDAKLNSVRTFRARVRGRLEM